ncbi:MAG: HD domain-containing protein [Nanobdellota archaeon]
MKFKDNLYGIQEVSSPIFLDLIHSPSVQRLKDISQLGMPDEYYHIRGFSRYEHSLGVFFLLKKLGAGLEEQVAGLLHDVSHTAFSHVIDWTIGDPTKEDYQDKSHRDFLMNSEIPEILKKHNLDINYISDYKKFNLLEREVPSLCADRLDYSLRESALNHSKGLAKKILSNLSVRNNQILFMNQDTAREFGEEYARLQREDWGGEEARTRYYILSGVLREALNKKLISLEDLKKPEKDLLDSLYSSKNNFILQNLNLLKNGFHIFEDDFGIELKKKFRYVDPEVLFNGHYLPLSKISKEYAQLIEAGQKDNLKIKKIRIIPF